MSVSRFLSGSIVCFYTAVGFGAGGDWDGDGVPDSQDLCANTPPGIIVDAQGRPVGDHDQDCDVDLVDISLITANFTGPLFGETCNDGVDNDGDDAVDCADVDDCPVGVPCSSGSFCSQIATCGCPVGTADCDDNPANGCETDINNDAQNCGFCNNACVVAQGIGACSAGQCFIESCSQPWCNADGDYEDGCEFLMDDNPPCSPTLPLWSVSGDTGNDQLSDYWYGDEWYRLEITEDSDPVIYLSARVTLESDPGSDYDLYLYCQNCTGLVASSNAGPGQVDLVYTRNDDDWGSSDDYEVLIEVRWKSGCGGFTLRVNGNVATQANNCDT